MFCTKCGAKNADDARFCQRCGQKLPHEISADAPETSPASPASIVVTCPGCGIGLEVDGSLAGQTGACPNCGAAVSIPRPDQPPTPKPVPAPDLKPNASASASDSASAEPSEGPGTASPPPRDEKKPKSALRSYLSKQARERPVTELKPVSKVFLWCLAIGPFVAGMIAGPVAIVAFAVTALVFLVLDQRAIKKSGRCGDGALWYFLILFIGFICIPVYLFCSGKDTKRGRAPGFVYLALLAVSVVFAILWNGSSKANEDSNSSGTGGIFSPKTSVRAVLKKANKAQDEGNVNLCGFYIGMDRSDAEALARYYRLEDGEYSCIGDPVWKMWFTLKGIRRMTNGGDTKEELLQAVANRVGNFTKKWDGFYNYQTIDGYYVTMDSYRVCLEELTGKTRNRAREWSMAKASSGDVRDILSNMVPIPGKDYRVGKFEVTQAQWAAVMGNNPANFEDSGRPVECVSWHACQMFLEKLNALPAVKESGLRFRLPTEEEWEYACRAGATGDYCRLSNGTEITADTLGRVAWFSDNATSSTHPVGQKAPNAFGLYDMHGNVEEWTSTAVGEDRVKRGGSWYDSARFCGSSYRSGLSPSSSGSNIGFRLCASGRDD